MTLQIKFHGPIGVLDGRIGEDIDVIDGGAIDNLTAGDVEGSEVVSGLIVPDFPGGPERKPKQDVP